MVPVAECGGVTAACPVDGKYAFYNSPYVAHRLSTGIDIYPDRGFGETAPSPVGGEVTLVRRVKSPSGMGFRDAGYDVVTVLRSLENPERVIKLLHVDPIVECGERVVPGQGLGVLLRSGYYGFGTSPHVHVEIRKPSDPLRARGGYHLSSLLKVSCGEPIDELRGVVTKSVPEFSIVSLLGVSANGLSADVGGVAGLLDGGIPYYGWLGAHVGDKLPEGRIVKLTGEPIAVIRTVLGRACLADCLDFTVKAGGVSIAGLSLCLSPKTELDIKLIPSKLGGLKLEEGSEVLLKIEKR
jgi:hypothetical protein